MPFFYLPDRYYIILVIPSIAIALLSQIYVKQTFAKYSRISIRSGLTGSQAAQIILNSNSLAHIRIESVAGQLNDHYDPTSHTVRLSTSVYGQSTAAAVGVAAHETGHAIQHATGYAPLKIRASILPLTNFGSTLSIPLIMIGYLLGFQSLVSFGILLFSLVTLFQLITLPVEFNASRRALQTLSDHHMVTTEELNGVKKVLTAAALTYVAALLVSVANLLRLVLLFGGQNRRRH